MVHRSPQVVRDPADLHVDLIKMPPPLCVLPHLLCAVFSDLTGHQRAEPVSPVAHRLMADVDAPFMEQILHVPQ